MNGDWLVALATLLAAIIGVLGGYVLARYQREKKALRFVVMDAEDLAAALRVHGNFEIKFADFSTTELSLSTVRVRNVGNSSIRDIQFSIKIPGNHRFAQVNSGGKTPGVPSPVEVAVSPPAEGTLDPIFRMFVPFLNVDESFRINALYAGQPSQCEVICRLPDTTVQIYSLADLNRIEVRRERWRTALGIAIGAVVTFVGSSGIALVRKLFGFG
jgi:hypothetical protein